MSAHVENLRDRLLAATVDTMIYKALRRLGKLGRADVLAEYAQLGRIDHHREFAVSLLVDLVKDRDRRYVELFRKGLNDRHLRYWSIQGYIKTAGRDACSAVIKVAGGIKFGKEVRANAIKCLAMHSRQPFDRHLDDDPGYWSAKDINQRFEEVKCWAKSGCRPGSGYKSPMQDVGLKRPKSKLERAAARLDARLAAMRSTENLASPGNWLTPASKADLAKIQRRWSLPPIYLEFLARFSPLRVRIDSRRLWNGGLSLFGATDLFEGQHGYSYNPIKRKEIKDWPAHLVVIGQHGGDPYVLDLTDKDAAVYTAVHGEGDWKFKKVADSFVRFLEKLAN